MPSTRPTSPAGQYDLYPGFPVGPGQIELGFGALAERIATARQVVIDGYPGVLWENFRAQLESKNCDLFIAIGSSLVVYPAAGFPAVAKQNGARLVILNREPTDLDYLADLVVNLEIGSTLGNVTGVD